MNLHLRKSKWPWWYTFSFGLVSIFDGLVRVISLGKIEANNEMRYTGWYMRRQIKRGKL